MQTHIPRRALDLLAKNQGHIASGVLQQLLARNTNLGAKLQTLQQVNEQTASHLGRGCASQAPRLISCSKRFAKISADAVRPFASQERISVTRSECPSAAAANMQPLRASPVAVLTVASQKVVTALWMSGSA